MGDSNHLKPVGVIGGNETPPKVLLLHPLGFQNE